MSATTYEDKSIYAKYLKASLTGGSSDCAGCGSSSSSIDFCECCPPGLIEVSNADGKRIACLTPNDAEVYNNNNRSCQPGYLALIKTGTSEFFGCVSEANFATMYDIINP